VCDPPRSRLPSLDAGVHTIDMSEEYIPYIQYMSIFTILLRCTVRGQASLTKLGFFLMEIVSLSINTVYSFSQLLDCMQKKPNFFMQSLAIGHSGEFVHFVALFCDFSILYGDGVDLKTGFTNDAIPVERFMAGYANRVMISDPALSLLTSV